MAELALELGLGGIEIGEIGIKMMQLRLKSEVCAIFELSLIIRSICIEYTMHFV